MVCPNQSKLSWGNTTYSGANMRFDLTELTHEQQSRFIEQIKKAHIQEGYYRVLYNGMTNEFVFIRADYVIWDEGAPARRGF